MTRDRSGEIIEKFQLVKLLGQGGMGQVYAADHLFTRRRVALKVLSSHLASNETVFARFQKEAQAAALVGHPNMVQIIDFGRDSIGLPYMAMEILKGVDLGQMLMLNGPLSIPLAAYIIHEVLDTVAAAHKNGVVHRDLKPENIFIHLRDAPPWPQIKLLDFGISKFKEQEMEGGGLTKTGSILGTPYYMSFEQASGVKVDGRSDVYSTGTILYQLLTGSLPFKGNTVGAIILAIAEHQFPRPRDRRPEIPPGLEAIVLNAMAKDRDQRFQSADEFRDLLRPFFANYSLEELFEHPKVAPSFQSPQMIQGTTGTGEGAPRGGHPHVGGIAFAPVAGGTQSRSEFDRAYQFSEPSGAASLSTAAGGEPGTPPLPVHTEQVPHPPGVDPQTPGASPQKAPTKLWVLIPVTALVLVLVLIVALWKTTGESSGGSSPGTVASKKGPPTQPQKEQHEQPLHGTLSLTSNISEEESAYKEWKEMSGYDFNAKVISLISTVVYAHDVETMKLILPVMEKLCKVPRATACGAVAIIYQYQARWKESKPLIAAATAVPNFLGTWASGFQDRFDKVQRDYPGKDMGKTVSTQLFGLNRPVPAESRTYFSEAQVKEVERLCQSGQGPLCFSLGHVYFYGMGPDKKTHLYKAFTAMRKGCNLMHQPSCQEMCTYGEAAYKAGKLIDGRLNLKITLEIACRKKIQSCCTILHRIFPGSAVKPAS
ncbi:protein kinase [Myxococcota bacterium]|nr:protein kinase [Myxococcota bacterium]